MITTLAVAFKNKIDSVFSNRVYMIEAPMDVVLPYASITELPGNTDRDSVDKFLDVFYQVNGYDTTLSALNTIEELVIAALDYQQATFSLADYYVIEVELVQFRTTKLDIRPDGEYQFSHTYKIHLQKK